MHQLCFARCAVHCVIVSFQARKNDGVVCGIRTKLVGDLEGHHLVAAPLIATNLQPYLILRKTLRDVVCEKSPLAQVVEVLADQGQQVPDPSGGCWG